MAKTYQDFIPKRAKVQVGEETLTVKEYTIAQRDAVLNIVFKELDVLNVVRPALAEARRIAMEMSDGDADEVKAEEVGFDLAGVLTRVFGGSLTKLSCISLDNLENRKQIHNAGVEIKTALDPDHGYEYCPLLWDWIKSNMTPRQEQEMVGTVIEVNDFIGLVKNYATLATKAIKMAGEEKNETSQT